MQKTSAAEVPFASLAGKEVLRIDRSGDDELIFYTDTETFRQYHDQDCCEVVSISEIIGELDDLIGCPILLAEEVVSQNETQEGVTPPEYPDSYTWTFYKLATVKGYVTIRWLGESNGYYSESVQFSREPGGIAALPVAPVGAVVCNLCGQMYSVLNPEAVAWHAQEIHWRMAEPTPQDCN